MMMSMPTKFAPVCPPRIYLQMALAGYIPKQVLLLAHDVVAHEDEYKMFHHSRWDNTTIIMDNSVVETGGAVNADMVEEAVGIARADIVVLPDVLGKSSESIDATLTAWPDWSRRFKKYDKMIVIQGETLQDWMHCAECLKTKTVPNWIAIPRVAESVDGMHRYQLATFVRCLWPDKPIHLLGFSDYIWYDLIAASHDSVRSIDSAVPLRMHPDHLLGTPAGPRGNWWETVEFKKDMIESCLNIDDYIRHISET